MHTDDVFSILRKNSISLLLFSCITVFFSCSTETPVETTPGRLMISIKPQDANSATRGKTQSTPDAILISIESVPSNELVYDLEEIKLIKLGDSFLTQTIELLSGDYRITSFLVVDSNNEVLYATPQEGSELAHLVSKPLPIGFSVQKDGATTEVLVEAVSVEGVQPEDFGYAKFALNLIDYKNLLISTSIAKVGGDSEPINGTFEVLAKNMAGEVQWSKTWSISKAETITIPVAERYTFTLNKAGHIPHAQHYQYRHIESLNSLSFELIPEGSEDFTVKHFDFPGNPITGYFPTKKGKVYARIDLPKDSDLKDIYFYVDCSAATYYGYPLSTFYFGEVAMNMDEYSFGQFAHSSVNLFDNAPYAKALDLREIVDLGSSNFTKDFDRDVVVEMYFLTDMNNGDWKDHFIRFFDKQKYLEYWCGKLPYPPAECGNTTSMTDDHDFKSWMKRRDSTLEKRSHLLRK